MSAILKLNWKDLLRGSIMVGATAVIMYLAEKLGFSGLDAASVSAGIAYLLDKLFSDEEGKLGGVL